LSTSLVWGLLFALAARTNVRAALTDDQPLDSGTTARTGLPGAPEYPELFLVLSALAAGAVEIALSATERGAMVPHGTPQYNPDRTKERRALPGFDGR
jgi:hypothetical protein